METYDIAIIGTGSGNSILDERYAAKRAAICEQGTFGGTCLNVGCIPTKMFVYAADVAKTIRAAARYGVDAHLDGVRWDDIVSRVFGRIDPIAMSGEDYRRSAPNIDVYGRHTRFGPVQADGRYLLRTDAGEEFTADQVVIAAGSRPMIPPAILACGVNYHTSDTIMRIAELPEHLVIVGSGFVAAEFAHVFSALGVRVTLVIRSGRMLRHCDDTICERFTRIAARKWELRTHRNVVGGHNRDPGVSLRTRRRFHPRRRPAAGGDRPGAQRRSAGRRAGRRRRRGRSGGGRRIPTHLRAWRFRARRCLVAVSAQARRQPRGPRRAAQSAVRLGRHRVDGHHRPPLRAVGGVHRSPAGRGRLNRKSSCGTRIRYYVQDPGLRRRRIRLGNGGHHRDRQTHRRARHRASAGRAHHGLPGVVDHPAVDPGDELRADRRRRWPAASTGFTRRCPKWSKTRYWACTDLIAADTAGTGRAASGRPAPTARRNCPPSRARAPSSAAARVPR